MSTTLQLSPGDIERIRFAYSPMIEVSMSFRLLNTPLLQSGYEAWVEETQRVLAGMDFPYMSATILAERYIVDFLTPTPAKAIMSFDDEIARLRATPDEVIRKNVEYAIIAAGNSPIRQMFVDHPREAVDCLIDELLIYWQEALEPHWAQIATILDNDVLFRARALALYGMDAMFTDLTERFKYRQGVIEIQKACDRYGKNIQLMGEGIQLVPSMFAAESGSWQVSPEYLPMLIYQTRGRGLWKRETPQQPAEALQMTLGASRARLLQSLVEPAHTHDLAQRLNLTDGAISQQLGKLSEAGLIESYRSGSKVFYRLSTRGERLLDVFAE